MRNANRLRANIKHFLGPILSAEVAQKRTPFPAVVIRMEMVNAYYAYYVMPSKS